MLQNKHCAIENSLNRIMNSNLSDTSKEVEKTFVKTLYEKLIGVTNFRVVTSSLINEKFKISKINMLFFKATTKSSVNKFGILSFRVSYIACTLFGCDFCQTYCN